MNPHDEEPASNPAMKSQASADAPHSDNLDDQVLPTHQRSSAPEERPAFPQRQMSATAQDIDDIPIPVSKPKTFEELLEEEMRKGADGGIKVEGNNQPKAAEKKQFLKRDTSKFKGIPTGKPND
mmetsp:Transcript_36031/g.55328  ORF Transcript_36031/g.55328 Transcript_36031/m.55328 type:complete len:124 (+) Transcript_36031:810-1181(+)